MTVLFLCQGHMSVGVFCGSPGFHPQPQHGLVRGLRSDLKLPVGVNVTLNTVNNNNPLQN